MRAQIVKGSREDSTTLRVKSPSHLCTHHSRTPFRVTCQPSSGKKDYLKQKYNDDKAPSRPTPSLAALPDRIWHSAKVVTEEGTTSASLQQKSSSLDRFCRTRFESPLSPCRPAAGCRIQVELPERSVNPPMSGIVSGLQTEILNGETAPAAQWVS